MTHAACVLGRRPRRLLRPGPAALMLAGTLLSAEASAEEISLLGGATFTDDPAGSRTYAWGLQYRQPLLTYVDASFGYLNEGHFSNNHRDGATLQLWADTGPWRKRFSLAFGAGPYLYFDTQQEINYQVYRDAHGVGTILTGRAAYALTPEWLGLLEVHQLLVPGGVSTRIVMAGVAYRLENIYARLGQGGPYSAVDDAANELGVFIGQTVLNNLRSNKSSDFGIEYRYRAARHLELSGSLLDEGNGAVDRHPGATAEIWAVQDFFARRLTVGLGVGPYVTFSSYHTADGRPGASALGLASMTFSWRFARSVAFRFNWHRAFTTDDQDRDILTAGLAWRF